MSALDFHCGRGDVSSGNPLGSCWLLHPRINTADAFRYEVCKEATVSAGKAAADGPGAAAAGAPVVAQLV